MEQRKETDALHPGHVDVLDGIRALSILIVVWFHVWQQSWLVPVIRLPFLQKLGLSSIVSFDFIPRSGFLFVDMMLLISAFCLFLPHARAVFLGESAPRPLAFYRKRLVRIVPPYYLAVLIIFLFFSLPSGSYTGDPRWMWTDLLSTLTFTQTFFSRAFLSTAINGVLWTAAVEMQFYLLFPLLAWCFRKKPLFTYLGMVSVSMLYLQVFALGNPDSLRMTLNQLPAFFGVFANGMLAAYFYVWLSTKLRRSWKVSVPATIAAFAGLYLIVLLLKSAPSVQPVQLWQASHRYMQSLVFTVFILASALSARWYRFLLSNRVMRFLALISYNLYIWHQWIAVKLKQWHIPYWEGEQAPNFTGDRVWQWKYTLLVFGVSLAVSACITYLFERPVTQLLSRQKYINRKESPHGA